MGCNCKKYVLNNEKDIYLKKEIRDYLVETPEFDPNRILDFYHRVYPNSQPTTYENALEVLKKLTL